MLGLENRASWDQQAWRSHGVLWTWVRGPGEVAGLGMESRALEGARLCARPVLDTEHTMKNQFRTTRTVWQGRWYVDSHNPE